MNFDIRPFDAECFVSDGEWLAILQSGTYIKTGNVCHTVFKKHVLTFIITESGNVNLLNKRRVPCAKYKIPMLDNTLSFNQRAAVHLERERLQKGRQLDDEYYLIYGT